MNKDEIESKILLNKLQRQQDLIQEFENLRPNWKGIVFRTLASFATILLVVYLFPEVVDQPVLYVLLILVLSSGAEIHAESRKINQRIDALYRLLKDDA